MDSTLSDGLRADEREMHVISRKKVLEFVAEHADASDPLDAWYRLVRRALWANFAEVRADYPSADQVAALTVFNIGGNKYRLITVIKYRSQKVFIRAILTHKQYDRGLWKADKPRPKYEGPNRPKEGQ